MKQYDITIESGADFYFPHRLKDDSGNLINLTGATVSAQLREYPEALDAFDFTCSHNGLGGQVILTMPHEATAQIGYTAGYYDVFVDYPDETREKVLWGTVTIQPNVTKPIAGTPMVVLSFASEDEFPSSGIVTRMYFSHASSKLYRWNGTAYIGIQQDVTWETLEGKPDTFPPDAHQHDDRYYTEQETDSLLSDKADADSVYTKTEVDTALSSKASIIRTSASGSLVHITDAAAMPVESLTVGIEPVQDLHGYDAPWPAGGGKNLLKPPSDGATINGVTYTLDRDADGNVISVTANGTATAINSDFYFCGENNVYADAGIPSGEYKISGNSLGQSITCLYVVKSGGTVIAKQGTGQAVTITLDSSETYRIFIRVNAGSTVTNQKYYPMICPSSVSDGTFAPYSNECPINGWSQAKVTRAGRNLLNLSADNIIEGSNIAVINGTSVTNTSTARYAPIRFSLGTLKAGTYTISIGSVSASAPNKIYAQITDYHDGVYDQYGVAIGDVKLKTFSVPKQINGVLSLYAIIDDNSFTMTDIQIEVGSTVSPYTSFQSEQVTIDLDGTCYGGTVDLLTGEMTVMKAMLTFNTSEMNNGENFPGWSNSGIREYLGDGLNTALFGGISNICGVIGYSPNNYFAINTLSNNDIVYMPTGTWNGKTQTQWIAEALSIQLCFPLPEPFTVQLSEHQLSLLQGENNVWSNTGDVSVGYRADTRLFIERKIAELQALILDN